MKQYTCEIVAGASPDRITLAAPKAMFEAGEVRLGARVTLSTRPEDRATRRIVIDEFQRAIWRIEQGGASKELTDAIEIIKALRDRLYQVVDELRDESGRELRLPLATCNPGIAQTRSYAADRIMGACEFDSLDNLRQVHLDHNANHDCDCPDCREYRRMIEELR